MNTRVLPGMFAPRCDELIETIMFVSTDGLPGRVIVNRFGKIPRGGRRN